MPASDSRVILGKGEDGRSVCLDIDRLVESRLLLQANSGGGKSWALRRILEETHGKVQQIVIDLDDEFHTLGEKYDYILARPQGGDCVAHPRSAGLLARRLLELKVSAIIGINELKVTQTTNERIKFVRNFLESLVDAPRKLWHPCLVVVDEAHIFAPQKGDAESAAAVIDLMSRGRKRGFCGILATQRISKLSKDAAAEANNKLIGRASLDVDRKRAGEELGFSSKDDVRSLRTLKPGEFFGFGPAISDEIVRVKTGPVRTTHPRPGQRSAPVPATRSRVKKALEQLSDIPKEAEEEIKSSEQLRRRVKELEREVRTVKRGEPKAPAGASQADLDRAFDRGAKEAERHYKKEIHEHEIARKRALAELRSLQDRAAKASDILDEEVHSKDWKRLLPKPELAGRSKRKPERIEVPELGRTIASDITPAKQRIVNALDFLEGIGISVADKVQLALLAGSSPKSSGYTNNLGAMRTAGLIDYPGPGQVQLTDAGRLISDSEGGPSTTAELHEAIQQRLSPAKWRIVCTLIDAFPDSVSKDDLAELCGASARSSGYTNNLGSLRSLGLIDYPKSGYVVARGVLFLEAG